MDNSRAWRRARTSLRRDFRANKALWVILAIALLAGAKGSAPGGQISVQDQLNQRPQNPFGDMGNDDPLLAEKRLRALNVERQKQMVSDANKLLKLVTELNSEVDAGNSPQFTPEQVRKVAEIEKLARSVKDKMSFPIGGGPTLREPPLPSIR